MGKNKKKEEYLLAAPYWPSLWAVNLRIEQLRNAMHTESRDSEYHFHNLDYGFNHSLILNLTALFEGFLTWNIKRYIDYTREEDHESYNKIRSRIIDKKLSLDELHKINWNSRNRSYQMWFEVVFDKTMKKILEPLSTWECVATLFKLRNFLVHGQNIELQLPDDFFSEDKKSKKKINYPKDYKSIIEFHEKKLKEKFPEDTHYINQLISSDIYHLYKESIKNSILALENFIKNKYPKIDAGLYVYLKGDDIAYFEKVLDPNFFYDNVEIYVKATPRNN